MRVFDPDGPIMTALGKLADIAICNVLFCLCCLPIFTAGASLSALYASVDLLVEDREDGLISRQFFRAFKQSFKKATLLWLLCLALGVFLALFYQAVSALSGALGQVYRVSFFLLCILLLLALRYVFPLQARYENRVKATVKNSLLLSVAALPQTLGGLILMAAAVYVSFFMDPDAIHTAIFLWAAVGFGLIAYLDRLFFLGKAFQKLPKSA
jgi:uncharacterized membrane protein YesL